MVQTRLAANPGCAEGRIEITGPCIVSLRNNFWENEQVSYVLRPRRCLGFGIIEENILPEQIQKFQDTSPLRKREALQQFACKLQSTWMLAVDFGLWLCSVLACA